MQRVTETDNAVNEIYSPRAITSYVTWYNSIPGGVFGIQEGEWYDRIKRYYKMNPYASYNYTTAEGRIRPIISPLHFTSFMHNESPYGRGMYGVLNQFFDQTIKKEMETITADDRKLAAAAAAKPAAAKPAAAKPAASRNPFHNDPVFIEHGTAFPADDYSLYEEGEEAAPAFAPAFASAAPAFASAAPAPASASAPAFASAAPAFAPPEYNPQSTFNAFDDNDMNGGSTSKRKKRRLTRRLRRKYNRTNKKSKMTKRKVTKRSRKNN